MPRQRDPDFRIHVDPSCLSDNKSEMTMNYDDMERNELEHQDDLHEESLLAEDEDAEQDTADATEEADVDGVEEEEEEDEEDEETADMDEPNVELHYDPNDEHEHTVDDVDRSYQEDEPSSPTDVQRWPSKRTEALIQAAARDILAHVSTRPRDSLRSATTDESYATSSYTESVRHSVGESAVSESARQSIGDATLPYTESTRDSINTTSYHDDADVPESARHSIDATSYHEEADMTESTRHSTGATSYHEEADLPDDGDSSSHHEQDDVFSDNSPRSSMGSADADADAEPHADKRRSARISDIPMSDQDDDFVPTVRGTPRPPFRSPSSVREMQMNSPPASVKGSPRSYKSRRETLSRLGSPAVSAQYSPKKTPPRFKRNTPPLVLLHATLLPLRWPWGHVLDNAHINDLSPEGKTLWEAWKQLQDRIGDTISDRGILLPHPQNDFEVLEERMLEALELPLRRRARILECGHYLGPSNVMTLPDEMESEDDTDEEAPQTHWCRTCHSDIKFDSLGPGKVFRVKVYASNGLMRAGAWEACWKEMERVDIEVEPIMDYKLQEELNHLAIEQEKAMELHEEEGHDEPASYMETSPPQLLDERRARDEERLREIYGHTPVEQDASAPLSPDAGYVARETPPSPSVGAYERREERRQSYKSASLPELVLQALRVMLRDRKNTAIVLLSVFIMCLSVRGGRSPEAAVKAVDPLPPPVDVVQEVVDPCVSCNAALKEAQDALDHASALTVEVYQTVTETTTAYETETTTAYETVTATPVVEQMVEL